jgi:phosphatidylserine/phosphatidylglycerophosphate/cardiolipin synthase-like enzyme
MTSPFLSLSRANLISLASALEAGRFPIPFREQSFVNYVPSSLLKSIVQEFSHLQESGATPSHIAYTLRLLAAERDSSQTIRERVDLVWTGQEVPGAESRDTKVVVQELFSTAKHSVLIASFALDKGRKAREQFQVLADRMDDNPHLRVRMFLNVQRPFGNQSPESFLLRDFSETFRKEIWCGTRLPEVFHDPRSLSLTSGSKACLHAKCVVIDEERVLITSANFTEAAHERNIEAGVVIADPVLAKSVCSQFETLVARQILRPI